MFMKNSTKILLEIYELISSPDIQDSKKILNILMNCVFSLSIKHHTDAMDFDEQKYAKIISQMIFTKLYNIRENLKGINFSNDEFRLKKEIIDTNIVANNIRNLFETVCLFNNFFIQSDNKEELLLKLRVWEFSSLKYRLKLNNQTINQQQRLLLENDEHRARIIKSDIQNSQIYIELDENNQKRIQSILKRKDYKFSLDKGQVKVCDWQMLADNLPDTNKLIPSLYMILSFYSHPTWKSIYDFGNSFKEEKFWVQNVQDLLKYAYILSSVFIIDYINYFPKSKESFNNMKQFDSCLIEFYNNMVRGEEYLLDKKRFKN